MMPLRGGGWVQGYNCQAATSSDGLIIATSVGNNPSDATAFDTIMNKSVDAAALIDAHRPDSAEAQDTQGGIGTVLADAGYLSTDNLTMAGPDRLIAVGKTRDLALAARQDPASGPPPPDATPIDAMAHRLRTPRDTPFISSAVISPKPRSPTPSTTLGSAASPAAESTEPQPNSASTPWCTT